MKSPETYMARCLQIAASALGNVAPNPLVGCVIVKDDVIVGEGIHRKFGQAHAEINAIDSVVNRDLLKGATLYVNLEPCVHQGKTPPCCDRIIACGISEVVYAEVDPHEKVSGKGAKCLEEAGIHVISGVLRDEELELNRRFRTFHMKKRPYVILKWAQSADGFMDIRRMSGEKGSFSISGPASRSLVHRWRSEEQAILVGTNTVVTDDPELTVRHASGISPLRLVIDRRLRIPLDRKIHTDGRPTVVYTEVSKKSKSGVEYVLIDFRHLIGDVLADLYRREIQSVLVEGGGRLLSTFLKASAWDEARVFQSKTGFHDGLPAPVIAGKPSSSFGVGEDECHIFRNP